MEKTMSIYAEKLTAKADFAGRYARLDKSTLGDNYTIWKSAIVGCLSAAYHVYESRHNNGMNESANVDMSALYEKVGVLRNLIGEVNGAKINSALLAETMVGLSHTSRKAAFSETAASADCDHESAKAAKRVIAARPVTATFTEDAKTKALEKAQSAIDAASAKIDELMQISGNYRDVPVPVSAAMFLSKAEVELRTIVNNQNAKSWEQVQAEKAAQKAARAARRTNKK